MLAAEHDDSELVCDSLRYVEPVQLGVQQPRKALVELVGTGKDAGSVIIHLVVLTQFSLGWIELL